MQIAPEVSQFIQLILLALVTGLTPVVVLEIRRLLVRLRVLAEARLSNEQRNLIEQVVKTAVESAEQSGLIGLIRNTGEAKKRYALEYAEKRLSELGLAVDLDQIAAEIEAGIHKGWNVPLVLEAISETTFDELP